MDSVAPETGGLERGQKFEQYVKLNNLKVVLPQPQELLIDIDSGEASDYFYWAFNELLKEWPHLRYTYKEPSKSGEPHCQHIIVLVPEQYKVGPRSRIMLQLLLGSDRRREMHSFRRVLREIPNPTLFLEKNDAGPKQEKQEKVAKPSTLLKRKKLIKAEKR